MQVPGLAVALRVMTDDDADQPQRKSAPDAADAIFKAMFSQVHAPSSLHALDEDIFCHRAWLLHYKNRPPALPVGVSAVCCYPGGSAKQVSWDSLAVMLLVPTAAGFHMCMHACAQTIMLLLGGFAIAAAFTKRNIARRIATWVLSRVSSRPKCAAFAESHHTFK